LSVRADVVVPGPVRRVFSYDVPEALRATCRPGMRVIVPFGRRRLTGVIVGLDEGAAPPGQTFELKPIDRALDAVPALDADLLDLTRWASEYYAASWGDMIRAALPGQAAPRRTEAWVVPVHSLTPPSEERRGARQAAVLKRLATAPEGLPAADLRREAGAGAATLASLAHQGWIRIEKRAVERRPAALQAPEAMGHRAALTATPAQDKALAALRGALVEGAFRPFVLFGVTGSGKTEVYLRAIESALAAGRTALYLVPEIGLTPLLARRMRERFGEALALMHSGLSDGERQDEWRRIHSGGVKIVLGARSAVFAPLASPGLIVVDEEHDTSYKQDEHPRYSGRDLALLRGQRSRAVVVLGSATPSVESYHRAQAGKYTLLRLDQRVGGASLPIVHRVDMRREFEETGGDRVLSRRLLQAIGERLARGEQSLVLLNRRGFSTYALCRACGKPIECRSCSIAMTLHLRERRLRCHYCSQERPVPASCPSCSGGPLHFGGTGTERLEATLRSHFPAARLARMDRDTVRGRGAIDDLLGRVERGEIDILAGTQMIAKGHDFAKVTLVGVLAGDALLSFPDFRAGERTFQLLAQVAGRSGRRRTPGEVIVQAFDPDHHAVRAACLHDYEGFATDELRFRRALRYPPFSVLALLVFRAAKYETALARAGSVAASLKRSAGSGVQVLGPAPAPLERLRGEYRVQVLLKAEHRSDLRRAVASASEAVEQAGLRPDAVTFDVDPVSTL
jgi:primosomal protein N' (replication factor Y)